MHAYHCLHFTELVALQFSISAAYLKQLELNHFLNGNKVNFTESQLNVLERNFQCVHKLHSTERFAIAYQLSLPQTAVNIWFENRLKKFKLERAQKNITVQGGACGMLINIHNNPFISCR